MFKGKTLNFFLGQIRGLSDMLKDKKEKEKKEKKNTKDNIRKKKKQKPGDGDLSENGMNSTTGTKMKNYTEIKKN